MPESSPRGRWAGVFSPAQGYALITIALWSAAYVCTKISLRHFSPESVSFLRCALACIIFLPAVFRGGLSLKMLGLCTVSAILGFAAYLPFFCRGLLTIGSATSCVIVSLSPVIVALIAALLLKERLPRLAWISIATGFAGVCIILCWDGLSFNVGVLWTLVAAFLLSGYNISIRLLSTGYDLSKVTGCNFLLAALLLFPFSTQAIPELLSAPPVQLFNLAVLGFGSSAFAYLAWAKALSVSKTVSEVTNFMFVTPFGAGLLAAVVAGEVPGLETLAGGAVILLSLFLFNKSVQGIR